MQTQATEKTKDTGYRKILPAVLLELGFLFEDAILYDSDVEAVPV